MPRASLSKNYDNVAKTLHWLIAAAILAMLVIGWTMTNLPKDNAYRFAFFQFHKSLGITILLLSLIRLGWRLSHSPPPLPAHMPAWEKFAAHFTHILFYVLIIGMPFTGWALVSVSPLNIPTLLYGFIPWPHLPVLPDLDPATKKDVHGAFDLVHDYGAWILAGLLVLHIGAAHKHHWFDRDDVLTRMTPGPIARLLNKMRGTK